MRAFGVGGLSVFWVLVGCERIGGLVCGTEVVRLVWMCTGVWVWQEGVSVRVGCGGYACGDRCRLWYGCVG